MSSSSDDELTTSRRTLLKGAVAAGVGVAAYHPPIVSSVPVYATHGLSSYSVESGVLCIWFSPNHQSDYGDWHPGFSPVENVYDPNGNTTKDALSLRSVDTWNTPFEVKYYVGTEWRSVKWGGHPNNFEYADQPADEVSGDYPDGETILDNAGWHGGGIKIMLLDANCEFVFLDSSNAGKDTASTPEGGCELVGSTTYGWEDNNSSNPITEGGLPDKSIPSPWQGDPNRIVYFHTGAARKDGGPWSMRFKIRCND